MGEIADDMVDGWSCSLCGIYFCEEHGFPVLCDDCWADCSPAERRDFQRATKEEL